LVSIPATLGWEFSTTALFPAMATAVSKATKLANLTAVDLVAGKDVGRR
jgi:hypothetical protein